MQRIRPFIQNIVLIGILSTILYIILLSGCASTSLISRGKFSSESDSLAKIEETKESEEDSLTISEIIDSLIQQGHSSCAKSDYPQAYSFLSEALNIIENVNGEISDEEQQKLDDQLIQIAELYTIALPKEYLDSIPANIAALVFQNQISMAIDTLSFSPDDSIILSILECGEGIPFNIPIVHNERVSKSLYYIVTKRKRTMEQLLTRANYYLPYMQKLFVENEIPTDLVYLPILESGFNPKAYSYAHASGIWQFIPSTGEIYGLRRNYWIDERRDPIKSTNAAIGYLKKLYGDFNNWHLALAAYNCGEGRIARELKKEGSKSFWQLKLPRQTMEYVPQFIAYQIIGKNPQCFGFFPEQKDAFDFDTAHISDCLDLNKIAKGINISYTDLKKINPHLSQWCTPPNMENITLYLPKSTLDTFKVFFASLSDIDKVKWHRYRIKSGDNLSGIANRFGISIPAIRSINKLKNNFIIAGRHLYIPIRADGKYPSESIPVQTKSPPEHKKDKVPSTGLAIRKKNIKPTNYTLKSGETVSLISEKFNITIDAICRWNKISNPRRVRAGTVLTLYLEDGPENIAQNKKLNTPINNKAGQIYIVKQGDNLYTIARKLGVSIDNLAGWNDKDLKNPVIKPGEKLNYETSNKTEKSQTQKESAKDNYKLYNVKKGDNITSIAGLHSVTVNQILSFNNLSSHSIIKPGDTIRIPINPKKNFDRTSGRIVYYKVQEGDNLWRIADHFKVTVDSLYDANNLQKNSILKPGDTVRVILPEGS